MDHSAESETAAPPGPCSMAITLPGSHGSAGASNTQLIYGPLGRIGDGRAARALFYGDYLAWLSRFVWREQHSIDLWTTRQNRRRPRRPGLVLWRLPCLALTVRLARATLNCFRSFSRSHGALSHARTIRSVVDRN